MAETPKEIRVGVEPKRTLLDRTLTGTTVSLLVCGAASAFLGVYHVASLVF